MGYLEVGMISGVEFFIDRFIFSFESFQTRQGKLRAAFAAVLKRPVAEVTCENLCQLVSQAATSSCHGVRWCTLI